MPRKKLPGERTATTLHIEKDMLRALRIKAAETGESISTQTTRALRISLANEIRRLKVFSSRGRQSTRPYEKFLQEMTRDGKI